MRLVRHEDPRSFLAAARDFLEANEAENSPVLGIVEHQLAHPASGYEDVRY